MSATSAERVISVRQAEAITAECALRAQLHFGQLPPEANSGSSHTFRNHLRNIDGAVFYFFDLESQ
jgi:hypothetical protein